MAFDLRTHIRDPKSGKEVKVQPYTLKIAADGSRIFIRDGRKFYEDGTEIVEAPKAAAPAPAPKETVEKAAKPKAEAPKAVKAEAVAPKVENTASSEDAFF
jgi:hypothetical protein